ncbi:hypothetical protein [Spirochaeta dissipatitropha]
MKMNSLAFEAGSSSSLAYSVRQGIILGSSRPEKWQSLSVSPDLRRARGGSLYIDSLEFTDDSLYIKLKDKGLTDCLKNILASEVMNFTESTSSPRYLIGEFHTGYDKSGTQIWNQHMEELRNGLEPLTAMRLIAAYYDEKPDFQINEIIYEAPLRRYSS